MRLVKNVGNTALDSGPDCYQVLHDVDEAMRRSLPDDAYFALGGIVTVALGHDTTIMDSLAETVEPTQDSAISVWRRPGQRRDIDIFVKKVISDKEAVTVKSELVEATEGQLLISVFGLDPRQEEMSRADRRHATKAEWVSSRTIDEAGAIRYELFPLERELQPASFEPWKLVLPGSGNTIDILHPAGHTLAYFARSISGLRHKDVAKVMAAAVRVRSRFAEEIRDGAFREWGQFADDIRHVGHSGRLPNGGMREGTTLTELNAFHAKSLGLRIAESQEWIVGPMQGERAQRYLNRFVHAK